ncbi:ABC transporter permease [Anaerolentibacter hominis]|uniref:ABC transporter permease n=1 Tax=Anaerolentibacter hominis TaxID=3079009 RepID=UPI0031B8431B
MEMKTLLKAGIRRQRFGLAGISILLFLVFLSLAAVLTVSINSSRYIKDEMNRMGYGAMTAWVSNVPDIEALTAELSLLDTVDRTGRQPVIYAEYETGSQSSDSEGQLILYDPERYPYKIFTDDLTGYDNGGIAVATGEIYISPSLCSMFGIQIGDELHFPIARNGVQKSFVVKGYFEDPFMGSSMIGMKSFLICEADYEEIEGLLSDSGIDSLARTGYMLHIIQSSGNGSAMSALNRSLNESTSLPLYVEFIHSSTAISGFMLTLQNVFTGFLIIFVVILVLVSLVVLGHSIGTTIEQDSKDMGILKALGFSARKLRNIQLQQYLTAILCGMGAGILAALPITRFICRMTVTTTGILIPSEFPIFCCLISFTAILILLLGFIWIKTRRIGRITPIQAIRDYNHGGSCPRAASPGIRQKGLCLWMALRQLNNSKKQYISACLVGMLLVFFASLAGRVNSWLGPDGKGLMDAFNPADLHIAAQPMGDVSSADIERIITSYCGIADHYMLAMPNAAVNGVDLTANVITQPERFHILRGKSCLEANEIVLTEFAASDLDVDVGDTVRLAAGSGEGTYVVAGIYQCANDMGANIGMNRKGYAQIGTETPDMWCIHYFLDDPSMQADIVRALTTAYGGDVYIHENSWPGLYGILSAMQVLMLVLYGIVTIFVLVVTCLTGSRLLLSEQRDMGIYKAIGFSAGRLRLSFALRFGITAAIGSAAGIFLSALFTDSLTASLMRLFGISNFSSHPGAGAIIFPAAVVTLLFFGFAWIAAGKLKQADLVVFLVD